MKNLFKVFEFQYRDDLLESWQYSYLHTTGTFGYHVTEGDWMLFEIEKHYITIGYDGWMDYKDTLLSGQ